MLRKKPTPQAMTRVFTAGVQPPPKRKLPEDRYREDIGLPLLLARLDHAARVKQSRAQRRRFHQRTHLAEIKQQSFTGQNQTEQLKPHCRVVAHSWNSSTRIRSYAGF